MAFKFRLQKILELKKQKEDILKKELADLLNKKKELLLQKNSKELEKEKNLKKLEQALQKFVLDEVLSYLNFLDLLEKKITEVIEFLKILEGEIIKTREKLIVISKEKKVLEKLKEKHEKHWILIQNRKEQKFLDEIAGVRDRAKKK